MFIFLIFFRQLHDLWNCEEEKFMFIPFLQGFGISGGLIAAIGAQNAFVLSQSVRRNHHMVIALICSICDATLIAVGIGGMGTLVASRPFLMQLAAWGGAAFLFLYGLRSFCSALRGGRLETDTETVSTLGSIICATLAVTLLNPHVYLDTIVLMGSVSGQFAGTGRIWFGAGAMTASFIWFFSLSLGGQMLAPLFQRPLAWRVLDGLVCVTMWGIAFSLLMAEHPNTV